MIINQKLTKLQTTLFNSKNIKTYILKINMKYEKRYENRKVSYRAWLLLGEYWETISTVRFDSVLCEQDDHFSSDSHRTEIVNIVENTYTRNTGVSSQVNTQVNTGKNVTINTH